MPTHPTNGSEKSPEDGSNGVGNLHVSSPGSSTGSLTVSELLREPAFIAATSLILQRTKLASLAGFGQFDGSRELFQVLGYPSNISFKDYQSRFKRGGIARRIVKALPSMMGWSDFQIVERPIDEGFKRKTKFEQAWINLTSRVPIGSILKRADVLAGIGEYSAIYLGVKERGARGREKLQLKQPISRLSGPDSVVYLRPLDQESCEIIEWVDKPEDVNDDRYGLPLTYRVCINGSNRKSIVAGQVATANTVDVHWSRVIHVTHEPLDNELFSEPALQAVWNYLIDLDKVAGGGSEAVWREAVKRVLFDLNPELSLNKELDQEKFKESIDKLKADAEEMMHNMRQYIFTRGVTPRTVDTTPVKFGENVKTIISLIAATLDLPQRRIMGSESAYASADQDKNTEEETITSRQKEFGTPLVRQLVDRLIEFGALPKPSKYEVVWAVEGKKKLKSLAGIVRDFAQANQAQKNATGQTITTPDEIRDMVLDMEPLEVEEEEVETEVDKEEESDEEVTPDPAIEEPVDA